MAAKHGKGVPAFICGLIVGVCVEFVVAQTILKIVLDESVPIERIKEMAQKARAISLEKKELAEVIVSVSKDHNDACELTPEWFTTTEKMMQDVHQATVDFAEWRAVADILELLAEKELV